MLKIDAKEPWERYLSATVYLPVSSLPRTVTPCAFTLSRDRPLTIEWE